jgi:chromosome segregation ATPase
MDTSMVHDLARDVLTLADALATAEASVAQLRADLERADHERQRVESERDAMEEQRDTARSALDGLVAAVRAEREAVDAHRAEKTRWQREYIPAEGVQRARIAEALAVVGTKRTALDAALATTTTTPKESR